MVFKDTQHLWEWRISFPKDKSLVVTNGCFDILHLGHVKYLNYARSLGDFLLVGINSDTSVKKIKGNERPIVSEEARAEMLSNLKCVDGVYIFRSQEATNFLHIVRPDVYVKAGDYTPDSLNKNELIALNKCGAKIQIAPFIEGFSTTSIINKIKK